MTVCTGQENTDSRPVRACVSVCLCVYVSVCLCVCVCEPC